MGAHLEAQATKMRAIFVVIALSLIATAFTSTHEEALSEATELIATMKKKGATEADCKDLAKTTCKEVLSEVKKAQKIIDSQSSGAECDRLGQRTVIYATRHYHKRMTQWRIAKKTITTLAHTKINLGVKTFISLKPGKCGFIFSSRIYRSTYAKYTRAVKYERTVRGWVIESKKALHRVRIQQKKMQEKCRCSVVKRRDSIWLKFNSSKSRARQLKALQKCKMMQCVLKGIKTSNKQCRATLPSLRNKVLSRNTEHAKRSGICRRHAKENHLKGERKSKSRARERKAKQIRKEKSAKAVRREKSAKAARRERAAKARAREQKAKHHEKRAKAAERSSKERSGKRERSHKARLRVERANKSKIRARRHWWHGNINGWDGHMNCLSVERLTSVVFSHGTTMAARIVSSDPCSPPSVQASMEGNGRYVVLPPQWIRGQALEVHVCRFPRCRLPQRWLAWLANKLGRPFCTQLRPQPSRRFLLLPQQPQGRQALEDPVWPPFCPYVMS